VPLLLIAMWAIHEAGAGSESSREAPLVFQDVPSQTKEFIGYYHSLSLDREQAEIKERVLGSITASCCRDFSILTCCCPCNFAKSVWGLSHYAIVKLHYNEEQLKRAVLAWIRAVNPGGFTGDACYEKRCGKSFAANGCGGMREDRIIF
jgi:hypothetical protein